MQSLKASQTYQYLNNLTLSFQNSFYERLYQSESKPFTLNFFRRFLWATILICCAFILSSIVDGTFYTILFISFGIVTSLIGIYLTKKMINLNKIIIDIIFSIIVMSLFLVHVDVILLKKIENEESNNFLIFYLGFAMHSLLVFLYISKINWLVLLISCSASYISVISKFLLHSSNLKEGIGLAITLQISICGILMFFTIYFNQKQERLEFYERKKAEEKLKMFEKLINEIIPNQIIILSSKKQEIIYRNKITSDFLNIKDNDSILSELSKFKFRKISEKNTEFNDFKDEYTNIINESNLNFMEFQEYEVFSVNFFDSETNISTNEKVDNNIYFSAKIGKIHWEPEDAFLLLLNDTSSIINYKKLKELDQYKDILLATVSHDLRTPLGGITGMLELIYESSKDEEIQKNTILALKSAKILTYMINDILDFSQFSNKKLKLNIKSVSVNEAIEEVIPIIKFQSQHKNLEFRELISHEASSVKILVDPIRLKQILFNLLGNAIKFTTKGYVSLEITTSYCIESIKKVMNFKVKDTGVGIKAENTDKIFTLFGKLKQTDNQLNTNGVGLGLVISNNLAQMMSIKGKGIKLESEPNIGSEFSFQIPIDEETLNENNSLNELKTFDNFNVYDIDTLYQNSLTKFSTEKNIKYKIVEKNRILIVDDDAMNNFIHSKYLECFKIKYDCCLNGKEALDKIIDYKNKKEFYSLIIMDCNMPVMNGFDAAENIKIMIENNVIPYVPIIAVTANVSINEIEHCKNCGMEHFLSKPVEKIKLKKKIEEILKINII